MLADLPVDEAVRNPYGCIKARYSLRDYLNHWHYSRVSEDYIRRPALAQIEQHLKFATHSGELKSVAPAIGGACPELHH